MLYAGLHLSLMLYVGLAYHINPKCAHVGITRLERVTARTGEGGGGVHFSKSYIFNNMVTLLW